MYLIEKNKFQMKTMYSTAGDSDPSAGWYYDEHGPWSEAAEGCF